MKHSVYLVEQAEEPTLIGSCHTRLGALALLVRSLGEYPMERIVLVSNDKQREHLFAKWREATECDECGTTGDRPHAPGCSWDDTFETDEGEQL